MAVKIFFHLRQITWQIQTIYTLHYSPVAVVTSTVRSKVLCSSISTVFASINGDSKQLQLQLQW